MRWRREKRETGLRSITSPGPSHWLLDGDKRIACASPVRTDDGIRWYWVVGWDSDLPRINTAGNLLPSVEEAKAQAMAYVRQHLKKVSAAR